MRYLKSYKLFETKYYHGSDESHDFEDRGYLLDGSFFSTSKDVAKNYGKNIYQVEIKTDNLFDPYNEEHLNRLYNYFGEIYDPYDDSKIEKEDWGMLSDTWSILEQDSIINWIRSEGFDGVKVIEGGSESNIFLFKPKDKVKIIQKY